ncbi:MAG: nucleotidyltransferase family protein [Chloroflexota bacterium]
MGVVKRLNGPSRWGRNSQGLPARRRAAFWREVRGVGVGSITMRTLAPTHQLVHLAVHMHAHGYSRLLWLVDLDLLICRSSVAIDWERALAMAREGGFVLYRHHYTLHVM